jgi:CheY-like chemotaxis protein
MAPIIAILWDRTVREIVTAVLTEEGYHDIVSATNGEEGLRLIREAPRPSVILMDLIMPDGFGGRGVMRALNAEPALRARHAVIIQSPVINLETYATDLSADWLIPQPWTVDQLLDAIKHCEQVLESKQSEPGSSA